MITCDKATKQAIHSYVAMKCYTCFIAWLLFYTCHITTMLPYFKVYKELRLHSHVTPLLFTTLKYETYTIGKCCICMFSVTRT